MSYEPGVEFAVLVNLTGDPIKWGDYYSSPKQSFGNWYWPKRFENLAKYVINKPKAPEEVLINWPDFGVPALKAKFWLALWNRLVSESSKRAEFNVCFFCQGGKGRTGTALACLHSAAFGSSAKEAIEFVREKYYHHAVETNGQVKYVEMVSRELNPKVVQEELPEGSSQPMQPNKVGYKYTKDSYTDSGFTSPAKNLPKQLQLTAAELLGGEGDSGVSTTEQANVGDSGVIAKESNVTYPVGLLCLKCSQPGYVEHKLRQRGYGARGVECSVCKDNSNSAMVAFYEAV